MKHKYFRHLRTGWGIGDGIGWIRLFGRGIAWKDVRKHNLFFSERNGFTRRLQIGRYSIKWIGSVSVPRGEEWLLEQMENLPPDVQRHGREFLDRWTGEG